MQTPHYPEVPDDFGHWLAGFIDGEGSFLIWRYPQAGQGYRVCFCIVLRGDDRPILEQCMARTGLGRLSNRYHISPDRPGMKPGVQWMVGRKADAMRLVQILDRFPLRAKKARDYAIWREAVLIHAQMRRNGKHAHPWHAIALLHDNLASVRLFEPDCRNEVALPEPDPRLW